MCVDWDFVFFDAEWNGINIICGHVVFLVSWGIELVEIRIGQIVEQNSKTHTPLLY